MFVTKPNQNPALMPTRELVPEAERHEVYASIVKELMTNSNALQEIIRERQFPTAFFNLGGKGVSYSIKKKDFEQLLEVFEGELPSDRAVPNDLRIVFRMLKEEVDDLNKDCPVYNSHSFFWLR